MAQEQSRNEDYFKAQITSRTKSTKDSLHYWLPSGATGNVPKHEVLMLRDLCNDWMARHGATDIMGREVESRTLGTAPSSTGPQDEA